MEALRNIEAFNMRMLPCSNLASHFQPLMERYGLRYNAALNVNASPEQGFRLREGNDPSLNLKVYD